MSYAKRPAPDDLLEIRATLRGTDKMARHYRASSRTVQRWLREAGDAPLRSLPPPANRRPCPDDFAAQVGGKTVNGLVDHYRTSRDCVERWLAETGLKPLPKAARVNLTPTLGRGVNIAAIRTWTIYDDAAAAIQRHMPVYRCTKTGRADLDGTLWRVGNVICTPDELLARAARYERAA